MLNPIWLGTFKALVEIGHFTHTARKLNMTQPGVSQHIKKLEQACGYPLIRRQKKSFEITRQGTLLYEYIRSHQRRERLLLEQMGADDPFRGDCRLSCSGSLAILLYPGLLALQARHPELVIHLEAAPNTRILAEITAGSVDIGIVTQRPSSLNYHAEIIGEEILSLVIPKTSVTQNVSLPEKLRQLGLIRHPDIDHYLNLYLNHSEDAILKEINIDDLPTRGYVNQIHQILLPVSKGIGFTVIPQSTIDNFFATDSLSVVENESIVRETLYLVYRKNRDLPARFDTIISCIKHRL